MHARSSSRLRLVVTSASLASAVAFSSLASAEVPSGWTLESAIDGGTSSIGASIATTDAIAAVGAPLLSPAGGASASGAVYVYSNAGGAWTAQTLLPSTPVANGDFGTSVAASGNLIAVGAGGTSPAAYVFAADAGSYQSVRTWSDPASDTNGSFGSSVAVFAGAGVDYVAVAAPGANGVVYVSSSLDGGAWSDPPTAISNAAAESFGISVAFTGDGKLLVGDPGTGAGQVLVYSPEADGGWGSEAPLAFTLDGGSVQQFGNAIAAWKNLVVVTAPGSANDAGAYDGVAFVFAEGDGGVWTQQAVLSGSATESFGNFAPTVNDQFIALGSAVNTATSGTGQVDVWAATGGTWVAVPASALSGDSYYGQAVGFVGDTLFVGDTSAAGAASVADVRSTLFLEAPIYADGGAPLDAGSSSGVNASLGGDASSASSPDASGPGATGGDAAASDGGTAPSPASSGGCSCTSGREGASSGLFGIFSMWAFVSIARARHARGRRLG